MNATIPTSALDSVSEFIAKTYHRVLGYDNQTLQKESLTTLQALLQIEAAYWVVFNPDGSIIHTVSMGLETNCKRRFDRTFKGKRLEKHFDQRHQQPQDPRDEAGFEFLHHMVDKVKTEIPVIDSIVEQTQDDEIHLLILMSDQQTTAVDPPLIRFLFSRMLHALKLNNYLHYHCDRLRPNSYKAICRQDLTIVEAEQNFYRLLNACKPGLLENAQFSKSLRARLTSQHQLTYLNLVYSITEYGDFKCIEIYYDDPRLKRLTPKRLEIIRLIYLDREEIASRLNMSIRTLDDHFAAIYDEFGTREKKKILAETHHFPTLK